jgi:hypothetical protein
MIVSSTTDFREAARRKLPRFLFDYIDGGAYAERTMGRNISDLADMALRQRVLKDVSDADPSTTLFGVKQALPVALAPVGLTGMYARRGEVPGGAGGRQEGRAVLPVDGFGLRCRRGQQGRRPRRSGSSSTCCATAASCATCSSARVRPGPRPWCSRSTCPCPARAIATPTPA